MSIICQLYVNYMQLKGVKLAKKSRFFVRFLQLYPMNYHTNDVVFAVVLP